ncbi:MAG: CotH kinase family protein [Muribaculaceae bacterium]|nr:CotH kinase family protein [Muribaculaceae bacterium]
MKKILLLFVAIIVTFAVKAVEPSGTLPVVYITTQNNAEITSTENYINATFYIDGKSSGYASFGSATSQTAMKIRGRGQASWTDYDKKPYRFKLTIGTQLLGMSKSKNFALMAYADDQHAFLRATTGYKVSQLMNLAYTPDRRAVELVLNGDYKGLYFLTETVRIDKDRVPITKQDDNATDASLITGGWLLEIDNAVSTEQVTITEGNGSLARFTYKDPEALSSQQNEYLMSQLNGMDDAIYATDKNSTAWQQYIDLDTIARYYIVQEVMDNYKAFNGSTYLYKDRGATSNWNFGPVWDFGDAFMRNGQQFIYVNSPKTPQIWIAEIAKFPAFQAKVKELWPNFYNNQYPTISAYIDSFITSIKSAAACDAQRWPAYGTNDPVADATAFKALLDARVKWLNDQWSGTGVENIEINGNVPTEYYNLQGTKIANPSNGIFIKVQGDKAEKIYLKK